MVYCDAVHVQQDLYCRGPVMIRRLTDIPLLIDENGDVAVSVGKLGIQGDSNDPGSTIIDAGVFEENGNMRFRYGPTRFGAGGVVFDREGNIYMGSGLPQITPFAPDVVVKLDRWGRNIWSGTTILSEPPGWTKNGGTNWATLDKAGDLLLCGREWDDPSDFWKLNGQTGELIWSRFSGMAPQFGIKQIATDSENSVIIIGSGQGQDDNFIVMKYDKDGQFLWGQKGIPHFTVNLPPPIDIFPQAVGCCVDNDDNIYISIDHPQDAPGSTNVIGMKFDKHGNEVFKIFPPEPFIVANPALFSFRGFGITCDHIGNMFLAFKASSVSATGPGPKSIFSNTPMGELIWETNPFSTNEMPTSITPDSSGNIFTPLIFTVSGPASRLLYLDGQTGATLTDYPFPGDFPDNVRKVAVSRPDILIGPVLSGPSNLIDSGHFLDYDVQVQTLPLSAGDEVQEPGDRNFDDDVEKNIAAGIFRAKISLDGSTPNHDEVNNTDIYDKLTSSRISPAPAWKGGPVENNEYVPGNRVFHNSVFYICILEHTTAKEPGVHPDWTDFWSVTGSPTHPFNTIPGFGGKGFNDPLNPENTTPQFYTAAFDGISDQSGDVHALNGVYHCGKIHGGVDSQWRHLRYLPPELSVHVKFSMGQETSRIQLFRDDSPSTTISVFDFSVSGTVGALLKLSGVANEQIDLDDNSVDSSFGTAGVYPGVIDEWKADVTYTATTAIAWKGAFYVANVDNTGQEPGMSSVWSFFN